MQFLVREIHPLNQQNASATEMTKERRHRGPGQGLSKFHHQGGGWAGEKPRRGAQAAAPGGGGGQVSQRVTGEGRTSMERGHWTGARQSRASW